MTAYYNENDPYAAQWLRNLIEDGQIAEGDVDERSIVDVRASDLAGYAQCHFFAGVGGWSVALRMAGWPDDRPVWTGSCPCQPFSAAGAGKAFDDKRHLWPAWLPLIAQCRPATVFGEQVEAAVRWGWLDLVFADLEREGYACGASVLPACSVGAPHIRQRLWFVADAHGGNASAEWQQRSGQQRQQQEDGGSGGWLGNTTNADRWREQQAQRTRERGAQPYGDGLLANANSGHKSGDNGGCTEGVRAGNERWRWSIQADSSLPSSFWSDVEWLPCVDGKARPTQSGILPLAHGLPGRMGRLRAYGNAIVPSLAAEFIAACSQL